VEPKDTQDLNLEEVRMLSAIVVIKKDTSQTCARQATDDKYSRPHHPSPQKPAYRQQRNHPHRAHNMEADENNTTVEDQSSSDDDICPLYQNGSKRTKHDLQISNTIIIDSGSTVNILDEATFSQLIQKPALRSTTTKIYPYQARSPIPLLGSIVVRTKTQTKSLENVKFYVAKEITVVF